jgi:RHS repeat-associated protein
VQALNGMATFTFNLRLPGQYADAETGLFYNHFRDYDPQIGRYVQSDPIGLAGGLNTYAYADGAPTQLADRFGLSPAISLIEMIRRAKNALPGKDGCNEAEFEQCESKCGRGKTLGCYVTVRWRIKAIRNAETIRVNERTVNCRCADECDEFGLPVTAWGARPLMGPVRVPVLTPVLP